MTFKNDILDRIQRIQDMHAEMNEQHGIYKEVAETLANLEYDFPSEEVFNENLDNIKNALPSIIRDIRVFRDEQPQGVSINKNGSAEQILNENFEKLADWVANIVEWSNELEDLNDMEDTAPDFSNMPCNDSFITNDFPATPDIEWPFDYAEAIEQNLIAALFTKEQSEDERSFKLMPPGFLRAHTSDVEIESNKVSGWETPNNYTHHTITLKVHITCDNTILTTDTQTLSSSITSSNEEGGPTTSNPT